MFDIMKKQHALQRRPNQTGLPDALKERAERKSGFSFDDVRVERNSAIPAQFQALAMTIGNSIFLGAGQESNLPHELAHVEQQKRGIVPATDMINGLPLNDSSVLEQAANARGLEFSG
jgi:hypothetical protein